MKSKSIQLRITGVFLGALSIGGAIIIGLSNDGHMSLFSIISMLLIGFYFIFFGLSGFSSVVSYINRKNDEI